MVADMEVDMVADMVTDINIEIKLGEIVCHGGWLIGPKLFRPEVYLACASFKLCEFIKSISRNMIWGLFCYKLCNSDQSVGQGSSHSWYRWVSPPQRLRQ